MMIHWVGSQLPCLAMLNSLVRRGGSSWFRPWQFSGLEIQWYPGWVERGNTAGNLSTEGEFWMGILRIGSEIFRTFGFLGYGDWCNGDVCILTHNGKLINQCTESINSTHFCISPWWDLISSNIEKLTSNQLESMPLLSLIPPIRDSTMNFVTAMPRSSVCLSKEINNDHVWSVPKQNAVNSNFHGLFHDHS